jgi:carboxylesterase type B
MSPILHHPLLGQIHGKTIQSGTTSLTQYLGIPYASIPKRFSRSTTLSTLPSTPYDATHFGPDSIQPLNATETDASGNQFPHKGFKERPQDENCLYLNITAPSTDGSRSKLPVLVFLHGGAFFLGSGSRQYYSPLNFVSHGVKSNNPFIFVSINYRLSTLGFLHSPNISNPDRLPPNNALHDQIRAFEWIQRNISGFGGDEKRITALGQSAGGMSLALHSISGNEKELFQQMMCFSGSPVTMPSKTPDDYHQTFLDLGKKLKESIRKDGQNEKSIESTQVTQKAVVETPEDLEELVELFMTAPIDKIRDLSFVGSPCTSTELLPYPHTTMAATSSKPKSNVSWIKRAIYSSTTYDGGVSYNILASSKKDNAKTFIDHVHQFMTKQGGEELLALYGIKAGDEDLHVLERICQFESDIGFFYGSQAQVIGSPAKQRYFQLFDLKNPFDEGGSLPKDKYATHTWDIVSLLGRYDDELKKMGTMKPVEEWRDRVIKFICTDSVPWDEWEEKKGYALRVDRDGVSVEAEEGYLGEDEGRRRKLLAIAEREMRVDGKDFLWEGVCRTWLD